MFRRPIVILLQELETAGSETDAESEIEVASDSDVVEPESDLVTSTDVTDDDEDEGSPQLVRRTGRNRVPKQMFTYNKLGGDPTRQRIT